MIGLVGISGYGFADSFGIFERLLPIPHQNILPNALLHSFLSDFCWVSLFWALLNLIPVYPLDGGQITRNVLIAGGANQPVQTSLMISICAAGAMGLYGIKIGSPFFALMFGLLAYSSYQALNQGGGFGGGFGGGLGGSSRRGW